MKWPIKINELKGLFNTMQEALSMNESSLFMIEEINSERNTITLANYIFNKRYKVSVTDVQIDLYVNAFDVALNNNMFISVEFDEKRGVIIG